MLICSPLSKVSYVTAMCVISVCQIVHMGVYTYKQCRIKEWVLRSAVQRPLPEGDKGVVGEGKEGSLRRNLSHNVCPEDRRPTGLHCRNLSLLIFSDATIWVYLFLISSLNPNHSALRNTYLKAMTWIKLGENKHKCGNSSSTQGVQCCVEFFVNILLTIDCIDG